MKEYYVYILRCADDSYYVGMTNNMRRRLQQHESGLNGGCYTFERRPVILMHSMSFRDVWDAIHAETVVKAWSRKKKEALIAGDEELLRELARKRFPKKYQMVCIRDIARKRYALKVQLRSIVGSRAQSGKSMSATQRYPKP